MFSLFRKPRAPADEDPDTGEKTFVPVGWWRCINASPCVPFNAFEVGKLYACTQMTPSYDIDDKLIPAHRRSYRILPKLEGSTWSPYWNSFQKRFCYPRDDLDFTFDRRFTPREYAEILSKSAPKILLSMGAKEMDSAFEEPPEEMRPKKYSFRYRSAGCNTEAVIYKRTHEWGEMEVGAFRHGIDAQEYIDIMNARHRS